MGVPKAGALAKASDWTTVFPLDTDAWTAYTPTLTQSATVAKSANAAYFKIGRLVMVQMVLNITGAGTAANQVVIGLPVTAAAPGLVAGYGFIFDSSAGAIFKGVVYQESATTLTLLPANTTTVGRLGADTFTAALANGDNVTLSVNYQSAS